MALLVRTSTFFSSTELTSVLSQMFPIQDHILVWHSKPLHTDSANTDSAAPSPQSPPAPEFKNRSGAHGTITST